MAQKNASKIGGIIFGLLLVAVVVGSITGKKTEQPATKERTPEQIAADKKSDDEHTEDLFRVCSIRKALNNPASFKLKKAVRDAQGTICVEYTGTNAFNATVNEAVTMPKLGAGAPARQSANCAGVNGKEVTASIGAELFLCKE